MLLCEVTVENMCNSLQSRCATSSMDIGDHAVIVDETIVAYYKYYEAWYQLSALVDVL